VSTRILSSGSIRHAGREERAPGASGSTIEVSSRCVGDPRFFNAETLYTANDANIPIAIRKRSPDGPGINGNVVVVGFHPYFMDQPAAKALIRAVLEDFGERPSATPTVP
jgi:hypothetical protein